MGLIFVLGTRYLYKLICKIINKKTVDIYSNDIMNNLEAIEYKIKYQMKLYYNSVKNQINGMIISQSKPMKNIIKNENTFQLFINLKEKYFNYLKKFNEPQDK